MVIVSCGVIFGRNIEKVTILALIAGCSERVINCKCYKSEETHLLMKAGQKLFMSDLTLKIMS